LDFWQRLPNKAFFFTLLVGWLALFQLVGNSTLGYVPSRSLFFWMYRAYNPIVPETEKEGEHAPDMGDAHGNLVPLVVLGLFWWKRKELIAADLKTWWPAMGMVVAGLFFHVLGYAVQQPRLSIVGLFTGLYGLTGLAWGPVWLMRSFFPVCSCLRCHWGRWPNRSPSNCGFWSHDWSKSSHITFWPLIS
jgi:hypothetical protein